jgi:hypothetical protein
MRKERTLKALHEVAVKLLQDLGVDNVYLQAFRDGCYMFRAWERPAPRSHNGGHRKIQQGNVELDVGSE